MPYRTKQLQLPYRTFQIDGKPLRQFQINGRPWYPIWDIIRLLETTRNTTQIVRSLPIQYTKKLRLTQRPPTNMVNAHGLMRLLERSPNAQIEGTPANALAKWAKRYLKLSNDDADALNEMIDRLQGELRVQHERLRTTSSELEALIELREKAHHESHTLRSKSA